MAAQGYDSVYILMCWLFGIRELNPSGPAIKAAPKGNQPIYDGVAVTCGQLFTVQDNAAITPNMLFLGMVKTVLSRLRMQKTPSAICL